MNPALYRRSLPDSEGLSAIDVLDRIADLRLGGCMFNALAGLSATFDDVELREVGQHAAERGLTLDVALGQLNPYHFRLSRRLPDRREWRRAGRAPARHHSGAPAGSCGPDVHDRHS
jgi:hypothetical protein